MKTYKDEDGNAISLWSLCRRDPDWSANRIEALEAELKELKEANDFLREHSEAQADRIDELPELWAETAKLKADLDALEKDARFLAEIVKYAGLYRLDRDGIELCNRILEATKGANK